MSLLYPIATFTYASRILGADGIGKINFSKSIVSYFSMLAMLGMQYYGTREAAKLRDNKKELSKFVHEMLAINGMMTIVSYILFVLAMLFIPKFQEYTLLLVIGSASILLQSMGLEWLYQALEEYQYIAVRSVIVQADSFVIMLLFVKDRSDLFIYMAIYVFATYGSYILNFVNARKYILWEWFGDYSIKKHIKQVLLLFAMALSIQLYAVLDSTMLGFLQNDVSVGKYTAAVKINKLVTTLIDSVAVVLIPRLSFYIEKLEKDKIKELIDKSYNYVFLLAVPAGVGIFALGNEIIQLFSGSEFQSAVMTLRLLTPIVVVIPFNVITNTQTFVPMGKEKWILFSTCSGALTNMACNAVLIPRYAENGAAAATVIAETVIAVICFYNMKKVFNMKKIMRVSWQYCIASFPILIVNYFISVFVRSAVLHVVFTVLVSVCVYTGILIFFKNQYMYEIIQYIRERIQKKTRLL